MSDYDPGARGYGGYDHYCEECDFGTDDLEEWRRHNRDEHFD